MYKSQPNTSSHLSKRLRMKVQRRKKRFYKKTLKQHNTFYKEELKHRQNKILNNYGFSTDPTKTPTTNFNTTINTISWASNTITQDIPHNNYQHLTLLQPKNLSFHNLCTDTQVPPSTKNLLGLCLKFCIASSKTTPNIEQCLQILAYKIRTRQYLIQNNNNNTSPYIPQIYIKLKGWYPPPAQKLNINLQYLKNYLNKQSTENNNEPQTL